MLTYQSLSKFSGLHPYRLSHKLYIMQDSYIVYYSLQFSRLLPSQTGNGHVSFKDSRSMGLFVRLP